MSKRYDEMNTVKTTIRRVRKDLFGSEIADMMEAGEDVPE